MSRLPLTDGPMQQRLRDTAWDRTPLGEPGSWSAELRTAVGLCLNTPLPSSLWWGPDFASVHNDAFVHAAGSAPAPPFGLAAEDAWPALWPALAPHARACLQGRQIRGTVRLPAGETAVGPAGDWSYAAVGGADGGTGGLVWTWAPAAAVAPAPPAGAADAALDDAGFRALADSMPQMVFSARADGTVDYFNRRWYEYTGLPDGTVGIEHWRQVHTDAGMQRVLDVWPDALRTERPYEIEYPLRRHDGVYRWHLGRALPIRDAGGKVVRWLGTNTDIDDRKQIEHQLQESEARFRNLSDSAPVMIWVTRPDGNCEYLNKQWYDFTGQRWEEAFGLGWLLPVHPDDVARTNALFEQANAARTRFTIEYRLRRRDGEYRWCVDTGTPRLGPDGDFRGYVGSVIDITDRKRVEEALASEKDVLELVATGAPPPRVLAAIARGAQRQSSDGMLCAIVLADADGKHLSHGAAPDLPAAFNRAFDGMPIGPAAGPCGLAMAQRRLVVGGDTPPADRAARAFAALCAAHGLASCSAMPVVAGEGRVLGAVLLYYRMSRPPSAHDLTLLRAAARLCGVVLDKQRVDALLRELLESEQAARSVAERASLMKDEFLATLSHELRTPLNAILGWSQIMRRADMAPQLPPQLAKGVEVIERNARAQAKIIEDLLDMSAIISGKVRLDVQRIDLAAVVLSAIDTARPAADAKHIVLRVADAPAGLWIHGDGNRLQQIFWNLLSNAVKFTPAGGAIEVRLLRAGTQAETVITDSGEGIRGEFLPFVFDRFRQADASTTRRHGGLGLGLSIVKQLAELHGGSARAESAGPGQGSSFVVALPLAGHWPGPAAAADGPPAESACERAAAVPERPEMAGLAVLVVDDEADARELMKRLLEDCGAQVTLAASADEALLRLRESRFDVLVSDIGMPGEDGHALVRRVRALDPFAGGGLPAVALTAYARSEDRVRAIRAGFQAHVAKPVEPAELIAVIASVAQRR